MEHLSEEQFVLLYYEEEDDATLSARHLEDCPECRVRYASLQRVLNSAGAAAVPERGEDYGAEVWRRIAPRLPRRRRPWVAGVPAWRWAAAGAAALLLLSAGFLAGRFSHRPPAPSQIAAEPGIRERVLLAAVGDFLDRSEMVLVELANSGGASPRDISPEQERAGELVSEARLYRQSAIAEGESSVADLLEEVERLLLDVARGPSRLSPAQLREFRQRLDAGGVVFRIRVVNSKVRTRQTL